ncbi:uncharacterized protein LOC123037442 [Drosophila rhopaloa]|uniref:Uncharacterized protein n=1 Tax=Drosophila rhopaloa TaxID=1041015 RepID=A0ABM5J5F7_DRORH|nr:uncharacterized protein LOC123037442 [Drosophila rhopaloa]
MLELWDMLCLFIIDIALYIITMPDLPIWVFLLFTLLLINQPLTRYAVVIFNYIAKCYLFPYCDEWLTKMENNQ